MNSAYGFAMALAFISVVVATLLMYFLWNSRGAETSLASELAGGFGMGAVAGVLWVILLLAIQDAMGRLS